MSRVLVFGSVFAGLGLAALVGARQLLRRHRQELQPLECTTGRVVEITESDSDGQRMYQPIVEFSVDGKTYRALDDTLHGAATWAIGDEHIVYYDTRAPERNRLSLETGSLFGAQLLGIFGITFLAIGVIALGSLVIGGDLGAFVENALD